VTDSFNALGSTSIKKKEDGMGFLSNLFKAAEQGKIEARQEAQRDADRAANWQATKDRNVRQWGNAEAQARREGDKEAADWYGKQKDEWTGMK
jgi:hypothetical protein